MEATLNALGEILVGALPTFFLVLILHFYLKSVFFKPLEKVLHERKMATEGARESAALSLERASKKAAEYEEALRAARNEVYREQEAVRKAWRDEQAAQVGEAKRSAQELVNVSKQQLDREAEEAKKSLEANARQLADEITQQVMRGAAR